MQRLSEISPLSSSRPAMTALTAGEKRQLDEEGFLVLEGFAEQDLIRRLRQEIETLFAAQGEEAGSEFRQEPGTDRLANLVAQGAVFEEVVQMPRLLGAVEHVLGSAFKLSSLNARSARPHSDWTQPFHCDTGALPDERGNKVCNLIWLLDDFHIDNGAPRYLPRSHRSAVLPEKVLPDPVAPHSEERWFTGRAGTVIVMNAHLWHGGTANRTSRPRLALHSFYCRRDQPQQQYQKRLIDPARQATFSSPLRWLLALDDPLNDLLSGAVTNQSGFLR
jgi:ectoine hydroxylase-related dioxygenase (phytanoyl-CoA dioxygenase family)